MAAMERVTRILIREGSQPDQFLAACDEDEFHYLRGLLLLIGSNYEVDGKIITVEERPPIIFRLYQDEDYVIRFYVADRDVLQVMRIWRGRELEIPV